MSADDGDPHNLPDVLKSMFSKNNFDELETVCSRDATLLNAFINYVKNYVSADFHLGELEFFESASTTLNADSDSVKTLFATHVRSLNTDDTILENSRPFTVALKQNNAITQLIIDDVSIDISHLVINYPNISSLECSVLSFSGLLTASPNVTKKLNDLSLEGETEPTLKLLQKEAIVFPERLRLDVDDEENSFFNTNFESFASNHVNVKKLNVSIRQKAIFFTDEIPKLNAFIKLFPNLEDARVLIDVSAPLREVNAEELQTFQNTIRELDFGVNLSFVLHNEFSAALHDIGTFNNLRNAGFTKDAGSDGAFTCKWSTPGKSFIHEMENFQSR